MRTRPEVAEALGAGRPVVALETAVLTHGLPREPLPAHVTPPDDEWDRDAPTHLETLRAMKRRIAAREGVAAVVGVDRGVLTIGLSDDELEELAGDPTAEKVSSTALAGVLGRPVSAGATVSATLTACRLAEPRPIAVFATGGIGGVHAGWTTRLDVSADLRQLASHRVCVICSGAKSILDVEATLEALEALGVPVVGFRARSFARFVCGADDTLPCHAVADTADDVAGLCLRHWRQLGNATAVVVSRPVAPSLALDPDEHARMVEELERQAEADGVRGPERTPRLLRELAIRTGGRSLRANISLLVENAGLAAEVAASLDPASGMP